MNNQPDLVDYLQTSLSQGSSDLHISGGSPPCSRIDGDLVPLTNTPLSGDNTRELIYAVLNSSQRTKFENELELDFALNIEGLGRFRGNAHYSKSFIEAAFRHIPEDIPDLTLLGHTPTVEDLCNLRRGLILITGTTGSGKTTTLASMSQRIVKQRQAMMVTIEDPIEFMIGHGKGIVKQRQVGLDTHSFSNALRASLRQDPDVIVVSELRDYETIRTAVTAAETGHLVIGTLHTIDAPKTLDRLIDVFPAEQQRQITTQISNCLAGIISQRLIKREDSKGRVLASEILLSNNAIQAVIRERRFEQILGLIEIGRNDGMHTIDLSLTHLLTHGYISFEDAQSHARDPEFIHTQFQKHLQKTTKQK